MKGVKEQKKTVWSRFTSWLATTWLGKAWNSFKSLFSSNKSKATVAAESSNVTLTESQNVGACQEQEHAVHAAVLQPEPDQGTDQGEKEKNDAPVHVGSIKVNGEKLQLALHKDYEHLVEDNLNGTAAGEYLVYVMIGERAYCMTGKDYSVPGPRYNKDFSVESMRDQGDKDTDTCRSIIAIKGKLGLNDATTNVEITKISKDPIVPKVKSPDQANTVKSNGETPESVNPPATPEMAKPEKGGNNGSPNPEKTDAKDDSQKKVPPVVPKKPKIEGVIKADGFPLKLVVHKDCKSIDKSDIIQNGGYRAYVTIGRKAFRVIVDPYSTIVGENQSFRVGSVKLQDADESEVTSNFYRMKDKLGFNGAMTSVLITEISKDPIVPKVKSPNTEGKPEVKPRTKFLNTANAQQQVAGNGQSVPVQQ